MEAKQLRIAIAEKLKELPLSYFSKHDTSDLAQSILKDVADIEHALSHAVPKFYGNSAAFIVISVMMLFWNVPLALCIILPTILSFVLIWAARSVQERENRKYYLKLRENAEKFQQAKALYMLSLTLTKETTTEINTNLKASPGGGSQLLGLGIKGSITGKHGDIIITDDIVNIKDRASRAERELTKTVYQELQNVCNRGGRFINTGTPWHKEDAFVLMPNIARYDCYKTVLIKNYSDRKSVV